MTTRPTVSVVINTVNRAETLERTLSSFDGLSYAPGFEVIVVNGPSTDGTETLLERWRGRIKHGNCAVANLSVSRNIGIAMAAGDVVTFIDDDAVPESEWLDQLTLPYSDPEVSITGGHTYDHTGVTFQYRYGTIDRFGANARPQQEWDPYKLVYPQTSRFPYPIGTNSSFRRSALLAIGGFDEEYEYFLDETDVVIRLIDAGHMIRQVPNAFVHHKFAPSGMRGANRVAKIRYSVVKNHVYFGLRHARLAHTIEEIEAEQLHFIEHERQSVKNAVAVGLLDQADLERYELDAVRALHDGRSAADREPQLLSDELRANLYGEFLPFDSAVHPVKRAIVRSDKPATDAQLDQLRQVASDGWTIHLLEPAEKVHTVDWEAGLWMHRLADERGTGKSFDDLATLEFARLSSDRQVAVRADLDQTSDAIRDFASSTSGATN